MTRPQRSPLNEQQLAQATFASCLHRVTQYWPACGPWHVLTVGYRQLENGQWEAWMLTGPEGGALQRYAEVRDTRDQAAEMFRTQLRAVHGSEREVANLSFQ